MAKSSTSSVVPAIVIERRIHIIRGHKVMLDSDLAELYQVETFNLNKAHKAGAGGRHGPLFDIPIWNVKASHSSLVS